MIDPERVANIELEKGGHTTRDEGMCLMEAVAYLVGEKHSDHPKCVDTVLGAYGRALNDTLPKDRRQELLALIPSLPGTANEGKELARSRMAHRWLYRRWLPTALDTSMAGWAHQLSRRLRGLDDRRVYANTLVELQRFAFTPPPPTITSYFYDSANGMPTGQISTGRPFSVEEAVVQSAAIMYGISRDPGQGEMIRWLIAAPSSILRELHDVATPALMAVGWSDPNYRNRDGSGWDLLRTVLDVAMANNPDVRLEQRGGPLPAADQARHAEVLEGLRASSIDLYATMIKSPEMPR
jgi:hypothetical protein